MKYVVAFLLLVFAFIYGIGVGVYHIFPYDVIYNVKQKTDRYIGNYGINEKNTGLQKILIKNIKLNEKIGNGGGISTQSDFVFLFTNHGKLITFNWKNGTRIKNNLRKVPMEIKRLKKSNLYRQSDIPMQWYRVNGVYAEQKANDFFNIYVTHHSYKNGCIWFKMSKATLKFKNNRFEQSKPWEEIFKASPCMSSRGEADNNKKKWTFYGLESGGRIIGYNKDTLLVSVGDHAYTGLLIDEPYSLNPDILYGKILSVDKQTGAVNTFANGVRNPEGLYKDDEGRIWETEHGPQGGDELNLIEKDKNYGWPEKTYGILYGNKPWPLNNRQGRHDKYIKPVFSWLPSIGISNLTKIEGSKFKPWKGDLLVGSLRSESLYRLRLDGNRVVYSEKIYLEHRIRDMTTLADGSIVMITDDSCLIFMEDGGPVYNPYTEEDATLVQEKHKLNSYDNLTEQTEEHSQSIVKSGKDIFQTNCARCHTINKEIHVGPSLKNVVGRKVGSVPHFPYSNALQTSNKIWSNALLHDYVLDPQKVFPGSSMPKLNLTGTKVNKIVHYLHQISE